jgi:hypothetical protein
MSKRPSVIGDLNLVAGTPPTEQPATPAEPAAIETMTATVHNLTPAKPAKDVRHTSLYLPKAVHRTIAEIALAQDRKPHAIMLEGLDLVLRKYGHPSIAEMESRDKAS